ncbi:T9SS type A sorting domain-containing protein [Hymenobacter sp. BT186]|uniref:T9SS type A sorting domain-containing protein n=1 Tax=Hymenobacter telluris TaxID=2816474 RepID=A0A939EYI1_9BACT|nr:LamG-like jellyroll fold domain-containing protein [Hymenobacter telluris]MBO0359793.1 T9SS type A sorting domain-containing protein [Hymenobacter telluris]MBW3375820.1 T9SS type A sorting domain-containing protein [Hymenobacter norwichensis]
MRTFTSGMARRLAAGFALGLGLLTAAPTQAQTVAFPGAGGFGRFATGARGASTPQVYVVTNLNDAGPGSFRDAVSQPGRFVTFAVGGIITLQSNVQVAPNTTIAGQTAPGDGVVFFNKRITFTGSNNTICRYLRVRLGATGNQGNDASGLSNGSNIILDHMSVSWGMDEVFSINWDGKGTAPDNITVQNSIIGQGLHRANHSAGGLIQTPDGGKVSLVGNLYISNKTRNPKVKGVNEFVNNVVYDWGNGNRLGDQMNYGWSGDAYIMGGSAGVSEVNIINNYFVGGPLTPPDKTTPFSRGTGTFNLFGSGNYFDNNRNGVLDGTLVPYDTVGYPGIVGPGFRSQPFAYPNATPVRTALQAYQHVIDSVGAAYPRRDQVDGLMIDEVRSRGTQGYYVFNESDLPFGNGGLGNVFGAPAPLDTDQDGMPDAWEDTHGLNKNNRADAVAYSTTAPAYLNIEVYINSLMKTTPPAFVKPPSGVQLSATTVELPTPGSTVVLTWTDNSTNETHFVLERSADGVAYTAIAQPVANATTYTDNAGLQPNTTYYYRLKAVTGTEESSFSQPVSVKTPALPSAPAVVTTPTPTDGLQYAELTAGALALKWTGSANTTTYAVYFGTSPTTLTKRADVPYSAAPSYQITGLTDTTTYYWRVVAINNRGTADGPVWSFRTAGTIPPQLVGHWGFDETVADGTQIIDQSTYANHGVLGLDDDDQSIRVAGKLNNALDFATADQNRYVVSIPHQDQLYLDQSSFSLSFWMKAGAALLPQDNNTSAYLLCKGSITRNTVTGATGKRFNIEFKNKQFRFAIDDDKNKDELQIGGAPFFTGQWVHVVALRNVTTKKIQVYLNGVMVKEMGTKALGIGEASDLIVGNIGELEFLTSTNAPAPYRGALDELRVYNYALTPDEITALLNTTPRLQLTADVTNAACGTPAAINLTVQGGTAPYRYAWTGPNSFTASTEDLSNLTAGSYSITVTDANQATATQQFTVTASTTDTTPPVVLAAGFMVALEANGTRTIEAADVDYGSTDACSGIASMRISPSTFTCANMGANQVTLTVTDNAGNVATQTVTVMVVDNTAPTILASGFGVNLVNGTRTIEAADVDYGSTDNCGIASMSISPRTFTCANIGPNPVTLRCVDNAGNVSTQTVTVMVSGDASCQPAARLAAGSSGAASADAQELQVYPNPATEQATLTFEAEKTGPAKVLVYNTLGRVVATLYEGPVQAKQRYQFTLDSHALPGGVYSCQLRAAGATKTTRLLIVK